jgi:hypothetical protein
MSVLREDAPLCLNAPDKVCAIREGLRQAGYTDARILPLLGVAEWPALRQRRRALALYLHRTRGQTPLETLVRLFVLQERVPLEAARRAVASTALRAWTEVGLLRVGRRSAQAAFELCPFGGLVVAADWPGRAGPGRHAIMSIAASTRALAQLTIRQHATRTLDLGTGGGIQALLAAPHSDQVVAVDCNPRAIAMAQFNAQLNGLTNISWGMGNLFEPVDGQKFDLIVCCPPFIIGPATDYLHSHSGQPADQLCRTIIQAAPAYLNEGGYCQVVANWCQLAGEDWKQRLAGWCEGSGCDAWVLYSHSEDAAAYAFERISETMTDRGRATRQFDEWLAYYQRERIEAIGFGLITLRRSTGGPNWFCCDRLPSGQSPSGETISRAFTLRDSLDAG